jgi:hypothetical protein
MSSMSNMEFTRSMAVQQEKEEFADTDGYLREKAATTIQLWWLGIILDFDFDYEEQEIEPEYSEEEYSEEEQEIDPEPRHLSEYSEEEHWEMCYAEEEIEQLAEERQDRENS